MKKLLLASAALSILAAPAFAADAVIYEPTPAAPVSERFAYDWTGFYVGGIAGLGTGDFDYEAGAVGFEPALFGSLSAGGAFGGIQAGYDHQFGSWVVGAVADIAKTSIDADISVSDGFDTIGASSELDYLGTVRARVGYAFDRALVYAHGGWAYGETDQTIYVNGTDIASTSTSRNGWVVGGGVEYAITDNISFGTEYSYVDLGNKNVVTGDIGIGTDVYLNEDVRFHAVKAAVNFRF